MMRYTVQNSVCKVTAIRFLQSFLIPGKKPLKTIYKDMHFPLLNPFLDVPDLKISFLNRYDSITI